MTGKVSDYTAAFDESKSNAQPSICPRKGVFSIITVFEPLVLIIGVLDISR